MFRILEHRQLFLEHSKSLVGAVRKISLNIVIGCIAIMKTYVNQWVVPINGGQTFFEIQSKLVSLKMKVKNQTESFGHVHASKTVIKG